MEKIYNITIDGPAGSCKTTISKMVAEALNITYLDTGAMYRAVAVYAIENGIEICEKNFYNIYYTIKVLEYLHFMSKTYIK
mgnify:CR=1 FL=1